MPLLSLLVMLDSITWLMALLPGLCIVEVLFLLSDEAMGILGSRVTVSFPQQLFLQQLELAFCHLFILYHGEVEGCSILVQRSFIWSCVVPF